MNKKVFFLIFILSAIMIVFTYNDDFLYNETIMKIDSVETVNSEVFTNTVGFQEIHKNQKITGTIINGEDKGKSISFDYEETYSSIVTEKYKVGDKVFINSYQIKGLKRDIYLVVLICIFILSMFLVGQYRGLLAITSVIFNSLVFYFGLSLYFNHINLTIVCIIEAIIFSVVSLLIANGINKKSFSAILSVFSSIFSLLIILFIIIGLTDYSGINFNEISFITVPYTDIILPELFIGALGAIMDVAITMSSSISELLEKDSNISVIALKTSGKEIGKDIMSTMINVLFFTYLCSGLPNFVLAFRNGISIFNYVSSNFSLELSRFLVGAIGIVLTIPISIFISIKVLKREVK